MPNPRFPLGQLVAGDPAAAQLRVRLFKAPNIAENAKLLLSDLVEVDTPGYAASPSAAWEDPELIDEDVVRRVSKSHHFRCTGTNAGCNALGYYVTAFDGTQQVLVDVKKFTKADGTDDPRPMAASGNNVLVKVELIVADTRVVS